jgi:hypothetical protein
MTYLHALVGTLFQLFGITCWKRNRTKTKAASYFIGTAIAIGAPSLTEANILPSGYSPFIDVNDYYASQDATVISAVAVADGASIQAVFQGTTLLGITSFFRSTTWDTIVKFNDGSTGIGQYNGHGYVTVFPFFLDPLDYDILGSPRAFMLPNKPQWVIDGANKGSVYMQNIGEFFNNLGSAGVAFGGVVGKYCVKEALDCAAIGVIATSTYLGLKAIGSDPIDFDYTNFSTPVAGTIPDDSGDPWLSDFIAALNDLVNLPTSVQDALTEWKVPSRMVRPNFGWTFSKL